MPRRPHLIGAAITVVIVALLIFIALPVGGLILIGLGVYIGVLAHRARALAIADPPALASRQEHRPLPAAASTPTPVRKFFGLDPSYRLSATCVIVGILMFLGGAALLGSSHAPQNQTAPQNQPASSTHAPTTAAALPTTTPRPTASSQPVVAPEADLAAAPATEAPQTQPAKETQPIESPVENTVRPRPVAPQPAAPDDGGAVYYKNCAEARAAGAAPLHKGEPGYRAALDRDHDDTACE
ncbi:MAG: excalibur calcium-binding domain-containing protein [Pseudonocardiaceae bacterium]